MTRRTMNRLAAATTTVVLAVGLSACGNDDPKTDPTSPPTTTSSSPTPTTPADPKKAAAADAQKALEQYFKVVNKVGSDHSTPLTELEQVAAGPWLNLIRKDYERQRTKGVVLKGDIKYKIMRVERISLKYGNVERWIVPNVQVLVCSDFTESDTVDAEGNSVVPNTRGDSAKTKYTVANKGYKKDPSSGWRVIDTLAVEGTC